MTPEKEPFDSEKAENAEKEKNGAPVPGPRQTRNPPPREIPRLLSLPGSRRSLSEARRLSSGRPRRQEPWRSLLPSRRVSL